MRAVLYLVVIGAVIASIFWLSQRVGRRSTRVLPMPSSLPPSPSPGASGDRSAPARLLYGADSGSGWLRLSATQLLFTTDAGRVLAVERFDINGASVSQELPDRTVARPALVVSTAADVYYFDVSDPEEWVRALSR